MKSLPVLSLVVCHLRIDQTGEIVEAMRARAGTTTGGSLTLVAAPRAAPSGASPRERSTRLADRVSPLN